MRDFGLWNFVKRSITPLGDPVHREPRLEHVRREDVYDLHGQTLLEGFQNVHAAIQRSSDDEIREITVITGRSGLMRQELPIWIEKNPQVQSVSLCRTSGAYRIKLKKK